MTNRGIFKRLRAHRPGAVRPAPNRSARWARSRPTRTARSGSTTRVTGCHSLRGGALKEFVLPDDRRTDRIALMYTDASDRIWIAFASGQLGKIVSGPFQLHDASSGYVPGNIQAIYEDQDGVIWSRGRTASPGSPKGASRSSAARRDFR